ncbi:hypothetical protein A2382_01330 [Candidatus Woesebacteria bacterium RIFOXYB1_FULL_38_16]|uniref:Protein kinase domain-containing protein n=1 Tax=Candidatus Woesebacteria bacterium RIFOXYB1_FULL_38_16 TaxID=1802538 RepID=A0A1F8CRX1_9BACT|nr:MAG: hypothetical protein A2382_01330 [Candidatus Woesebacteria bacterium RIFOXYB1_FULL_38_16]
MLQIYVARVTPSALVSLDVDRDKVGEGANGAVYVKDDKAYKLYHPHVLGTGLITRLQDFLAKRVNLQVGVVKPENLLLGSDGRVVGIDMRFLGRDYHPMFKLREPEFVNRYDITPLKVARIFRAGLPVLSSVHSQRMCVGDHNDKNTFFKLAGSVFEIIDVDSFAFDAYGSQGQEFYLDPGLYGKDLSLPVFVPGNDWYSNAVMLYWSLLLEHPYGGVHRRVRDLLMRAQQRITLLDQEVIYPSQSTRPPSVLNADMRQMFDMFFKQGWRGPIEESILDRYISDLEFGRMQVEPPKRRVANVSGGYQATDLVVTRGVIVYTAVYDQTIYVVAHEQRKVVLYIRPETGNVRRIELFPVQNGARYGLMMGTNQKNEETLYLVVNPEYTLDIRFYAVDQNGATRVNFERELQTQPFMGSRMAIFRVSRNFLYIMVGSVLTAVSIKRGQLASYSLRALRENQTWFTVPETSVSPRAFGYYRYEGDHVFWIVTEDGYRETNIPFLAIDENLIDSSARFGKQTIMLLRKTERGGQESIYLDIIGLDGRVITGGPPVRVSGHIYNEIHGRAYAEVNDSTLGLMGVVLHPTNEGVKQEVPAKNTISDFPGSEAFVGPGQSLRMYRDGILVISGHEVTLLT